MTSTIGGGQITGGTSNARSTRMWCWCAPSRRVSCSGSLASALAGCAVRQQTPNHHVHQAGGSVAGDRDVRDDLHLVLAENRRDLHRGVAAGADSVDAEAVR